MDPDPGGQKTWILRIRIRNIAEAIYFFLDIFFSSIVELIKFLQCL